MMFLLVALIHKQAQVLIHTQPAGQGLHRAHTCMHVFKGDVLLLVMQVQQLWLRVPGLQLQRLQHQQRDRQAQQ